MKVLCWFGLHRAAMWSKHNRLGARRVWCSCGKTRLEVGHVGVGQWVRQALTEPDHETKE